MSRDPETNRAPVREAGFYLQADRSPTIGDRPQVAISVKALTQAVSVILAHARCNASGGRPSSIKLASHTMSDTCKPGNTTPLRMGILVACSGLPCMHRSDRPPRTTACRESGPQIHRTSSRRAVKPMTGAIWDPGDKFSHRRVQTHPACSRRSHRLTHRDTVRGAGRVTVVLLPRGSMIHARASSWRTQPQEAVSQLKMSRSRQRAEFQCRGPHYGANNRSGAKAK